MKNIKDITISIFAVIGFVAIITAFTNQPEQANQPQQANQTTTPESHVWQLGSENKLIFNKQTGEVRRIYPTFMELVKYSPPKEKKKK